MNVEKNTAGTTILIEFQKYGLKKVSPAPYPLPPPATAQDSKFNQLGQLKSVPCRISSIVFNEVTTIT